MPPLFSPEELIAIPEVLSRPRFDTYLRERGGDTLSALSLYHWNGVVSAAFMFPLHLFEVSVRNAISNAIESYYGPRWPWAPAFERSLPTPRPNQFSPRRDLLGTRSRYPTTGKVIADLKFAFWVSMLTARHEGRLWNACLRREFPEHEAHRSVQEIRQRIHGVADGLRQLRNRIAHHEPIYARDLLADYRAIHEIVSYRCRHTATWMDREQDVLRLVSERP